MICDKCGVSYCSDLTGEAQVTVVTPKNPITEGIGANVKIFFVCPNCTKKVKKFLQSKE